MIKRTILLIGLLLVCSACVSRTVTTSDPLNGTQKKVIKEQKLIWFWQDEYND